MVAYINVLLFISHGVVNLYLIQIFFLHPLILKHGLYN